MTGAIADELGGATGGHRNPGAAMPDGPVVQSIRIAFRGLWIAVVLLAAGWAASNIRQVPTDAQAVVLRFGRIVRVQQAGLVVAWPRPIEQIVLLPGTQQQLSLKILSRTAPGNALVDPASRAAGEVLPDTAGAFLTGDNGVVLLDAALSYRVTDPVAYYVAADHIEPALRRIFLSSAIAVAAARSMDDFMVIGAASEIAQSHREAVRGALVQEVNRRLRALERQDTGSQTLGLGVTATRIDVTALLPPSAKFAFDAVLDATQMADQGLAAARTDAARAQQAADQERDRILAEAHASADERVNIAHAHAAAVMVLVDRMDPTSRPSLLEQAYRERIAGILKQAGGVTTVDLRGGNHLILPAAHP
jgi:regulator of protease activity HflC (stomatin/prohibitin superfamily)